MIKAAEKVIYEFGEFRFDTEGPELWRKDDRVALPQKSLEMLALLIERRGRTVTKDELLGEIWRDTFVDENNLAVNVAALRRSFGVKATDKNFIETVSGRGYRFTADIREVGSNGDLIFEKQTETRIAVNQTTETVEPASNIAALQSRLRRHSIVLGSLALFIFASGIFLAYSLRGSISQTNLAQTNPPRTIAVLPLKNLSKDEADESLSVGLTDALISKLSNVKNLAVRPTSAVLPFASNQETLQAIGETLQVETVLEGTIQREGERLRVSVQLIRVSDNQVMWAGNFDEQTVNLFKFQDAFAANITDTLAFKLSDDERMRIARRETDNAEAFQLYLKGRYFWNKRTPKDLQKSTEFFEQARTNDPNYALAYVGLADSYKMLAEYNAMPAAEAFAKAREAATKAIELDPNSGEAHTSLAYTLAFYDWNWQEAEREFRKAIELNPNYATAHQWYSEYLIVFGRFDEGMAEIERARELDPTSLIIASAVAGHFYMARQFDRTIGEAGKVIERDSSFLYGYYLLWLSYDQKGMTDQAAEAIFKLDGLYFPPELLAAERKAFEKNGWHQMWRLKYEQSIQPPLNAFFNDYIRALAALRAGHVEKTFYWLEKSLAQRNRWIVNLKYDPQWDSIRTDPRFNEIVRRTNLEP